MKPKRIAIIILFGLCLTAPAARMRFIPWANVTTGGTGVITGVISLASNSNTTDGTVFTTASFTPTANSLLVACFASIRGSSGDPSVVTVTDSAGLTWTQISEFQYVTTGTSKSRVAIYATRSPSSPASMTITGTYPVTISGCSEQIFEVLGTDVANGVSQTFVQHVNTTVNSTGTSASITLASAGNANNRPFLFVAHFSAEGITPRTNWTEIGDTNAGSPPQSAEAQWRTDTFETTASATWTTSVSYGGTAFEIKAQ
jgi:hypothetical protein